MSSTIDGSYSKDRACTLPPEHHQFMLGNKETYVQAYDLVQFLEVCAV